MRSVFSYTSSSLIFLIFALFFMIDCASQQTTVKKDTLQSSPKKLKESISQSAKEDSSKKLIPEVDCSFTLLTEKDEIEKILTQGGFNIIQITEDIVVATSASYEIKLANDEILLIQIWLREALAKKNKRLARLFGLNVYRKGATVVTYVGKNEKYLPLVQRMFDDP